MQRKTEKEFKLTGSDEPMMEDIETPNSDESETQPMKYNEIDLDQPIKLQ